MLRAVTGIFFAAFIAVSPAEAHIFGAGGAGLFEGLAHPLLGLDHVLAMVAVGVWASQLGRPAWWVLPIVFPVAMVFGGVLGWLEAPIPAVELGIALSVLVLGLVIGLSAKPGLLLSVPLVALFAIFHGYAHGVELPEAASPLFYGLGFILSTVFLHVAGLAIGWLGGNFSTTAYRIAGLALSAAGVGILFVQP
jgi:urease accessory protein